MKGDRGMALGGMDKPAFVDDVNATVIKSSFVVDPQYNADALTLDWTIKDMNGEGEYTLKFSMGTKSGFFATGGGRYAKSVKHPQPVKGTVYGALCTYCIENLGMLDVLKTRFTDIEAGGVEFLDAEGWVGLEFSFKIMPPADIGLAFKRLDERANKDRLWPVKFLGVNARVKPDLAVKSTLEKGKDDAKEKELIAKLQEIVKQSDTFDQFIMQAITLPNLHEYPTLQKAVADPYDFFPAHKI